MAAIASDSSSDYGDFGFDDYGADAAATTPLALDVTAIRPAITARRAAPVTRALADTHPRPSRPSHPADSSPVSPVSHMRRVRLSHPASRPPVAQAVIVRWFAAQQAPRWHERLGRWLSLAAYRARRWWSWQAFRLLRTPSRARSAWWDTLGLRDEALMASGQARAVAEAAAVRPALRVRQAAEWARVWRLARQIIVRNRHAELARWTPDGDLWRLQVAALLRQAGVRVEAVAGQYNATHYISHDRADEQRDEQGNEQRDERLGALTNPTLETVLGGHVARHNDQSTWPAIPTAPDAAAALLGARPAPSATKTRYGAPPAPPILATYSSDYRPLQSLEVALPPPPPGWAHLNPGDTPDPWRGRE